MCASAQQLPQKLYKYGSAAGASANKLVVVVDVNSKNKKPIWPREREWGFQTFGHLERLKNEKKKKNKASLLVDPVNGARHQQQQRP